MTYWSYYLLWMLFVYVVREPRLLVGLLVLLVMRKLIPDPTALFRALSRSGALRAQVELNPANVTARRDLAQIYLDVLRPAAALTLVEQALARTPDEPELLYLAGLALHRVGRHEDALPRLVRAVELDARVRFGQPYLVAGDSLFALGRYEEAIDAYERYQRTNSSDVAGYIRLARAHRRHGERAAARKAIDDAESTWRSLPAGMRRRGWLRGSLAPFWARIVVLKDPAAIVKAVLAAAAIGGAGVYVYPRAVQAFHQEGMPRRMGIARCGTQSTGSFAGKYVALDPPPRPIPPNLTDVQHAALAQLEQSARQQLENFEIGPDRIRSGGGALVQEFCLTQVFESTPERLRAEALHHEDVADPGDASTLELLLAREGDLVHFTIEIPAEGLHEEIAVLRRKD